MKKFFSFIIAIVMILSAVSAFAVEINWSDLEEPGAEMIANGEFVDIEELGLVMWVPNAFLDTELSEEDYEAGYIAYYMTEDEAYAISVMYVDADGLSLEEYKGILPEYGASEIEDVTVNGLPAVGYVLADDDVAAIAFATEMGYIFEVTGSPKSDEGFASVLIYVMASIQAA